jgi:DNA-binding response OmpR family regulator
MAWTFGDFRLDPDRFELSFRGTAMRLEPQVLGLLIYLIRNRERMVSKDEVAQAI